MLIDHKFMTTLQAPESDPGLYEYLIAANGVFVRAERPGLRAMIWESGVVRPIGGLYSALPYVQIAPVPARLLRLVLELSLGAAPMEALFWLLPDPWRLVMPSQIQSGGTVRPADQFHPAAKDALIEIHSHHDMAPFFSSTDNQDEQGFRIYAVLGHIHRRPTIRVRVGIYGHFMDIPAGWVFGMPGYITDALAPAREAPRELDEDDYI